MAYRVNSYIGKGGKGVWVLQGGLCGVSVVERDKLAMFSFVRERQRQKE